MKPTKRKDGFQRQVRNDRLQRLGYTSYRKYINSRHWRAVRARAKAAGMTQCARCGGMPIELHHKTYVRLGRERLSDLLALCRICHKATHQNKKPLKFNWSAVTVYYREPEPIERKDAAAEERKHA